MQRPWPTNWKGKRMPPEYFLGLDLGQAADWSALAVLERTTMPQESTVRCEHAWQFGCRGLKRWPLGTSYPTIVDNVAALVQKPPLRDAHLVIDGTGVGRPVVDMFVKAMLPVEIVAVLITAGNKQHCEDGYYHVAKVILISTLQVLLQERRLRFARALPETATLVKELQDYRVKITPAANEVFNAREGAHDDLLLALALAAWQGERMPPPSVPGPVVLVPGRSDPCFPAGYRVAW